MSRVKLNGAVVNDADGRIYAHYGYQVIYPQMVRDAIANNPDGEDLVLELNSGGGSVFNGFEIYSVLRNASCRTVAEVQSLAASAASTIAIACQQVLISPVGQIMIHDPRACTCGNRKEHMDSVQVLDAIKESILNAYELRCKGHATRDKLRDLMTASTWLPAQQAVELGLADGVLYRDATDPATVVNAYASGISNAVGDGLPDIAELKARYDAEQAGNPSGDTDPGNDDAPPPTDNPPQNEDDWACKARQEIETNRYLTF